MIAFDRIAVDPKKMAGQACIRDIAVLTRVKSRQGA